MECNLDGINEVMIGGASIRIEVVHNLTESELRKLAREKIGESYVELLSLDELITWYHSTQGVIGL